MVRREEARLKRLFRRLLLLSLASPAVANACSSASVSTSGGVEDAGADARDVADATTQYEAADDSASSRDDGTTVADGSELADGGGGGPVDAGVDAEADAAASCIPSALYVTDASFVATSSAAEDAGEASAPSAAVCLLFEDLPCGLPASTVTDGCFLYLSECASLFQADGGFYDCQIWGAQCVDADVVDLAGPITIAFDECSAIGRRPAGLAPIPMRRARARTGSTAKSPLGDYFARAAHLEAASVVAFEALGDELFAHRAPTDLVRMAGRSARDEKRHARVVGTLARRFGGTPAKVRAPRPRPRSLEAMARENAVEGCVRETFGAMVATWQATHARDSGVRAAMKRIAADETRHAALAWAVARWADARLDDAARGRIRAARDEAVRELSCAVSTGAAGAVMARAGLPPPARARAFVAALAAELW